MGTREKWLLSILTGVFVIQTATLIWGVQICSKITPKSAISDVCPQLGERYDLTFGTMIATTLALLTGSTLASATKKPEATEPRKYIPPEPGRK